MSWNLYDSAARPIDALATSSWPRRRQLEPVPPGRRAPRAALLHRVHRVRAAAGAAGAEHALHRRLAGGTFLYRVYVPDAGRDAKGGVPLPRVTLEPAGGSGGAARAWSVPRAPGALRVAAERPDRRAPGCPTRRTTATASPAATRRAGGCSRTSAARRSTSCSTTRRASRSTPAPRALRRRPGLLLEPGHRVRLAPALARASASCSCCAGARPRSPTRVPARPSCRAGSSSATGRSASTSRRPSG